MAHIFNATLSIKPESRTKSRLTVRYYVSFNVTERKNPTRFKEKIKIYGDDPLIDDYITTFSQGAFTSQKDTLKRKRTKIVNNSALNEDWGKDEIYAKIFITPVLPSADSAKTNTVNGWF